VVNVEALLRSGIASFTLVCAGAAWGQAPFPAKPIRIVASEAGGGGDFSARLIAQGLGPALNQTVIVDNRAGGVVAGDFVSKSAPDGYTLLNYGNTFWLLPLMREHMPYDPVRDFLPVTTSVRAIAILVIHPSVPVKSVKELIALAKARPGELNYGSGAAGASNHLAVELLKSMAGVNITRIPFKGMPSALNSLMSGDIQLMVPLLVSAMPHVKTGRLRALAVTTAKPTDIAPGMPTVASFGLPGYEASGTYGIFAPAKTPAAVISRLNQEIAAVLGKADTREKFSRSGMEVVGSTPEELATIMRTEIVVMGKVVRDAGIRDQ
jgi:tripartite-type tricarboxylate transporter receptor subunit TctC